MGVARQQPRPSSSLASGFPYSIVRAMERAGALHGHRSLRQTVAYSRNRLSGLIEGEVCGNTTLQTGSGNRSLAGRSCTFSRARSRSGCSLWMSGHVMVTRKLLDLAAQAQDAFHTLKLSTNSSDREQSMKLTSALTLGVVLIASAALAREQEGTLQAIQATKTIRLGYLEAAVPFSFLGKEDTPAGYSVELCARVAEGIRQQLRLLRLEVRWIVVTSDNRFDMVKNGKIDLECGASSNTLSRQTMVDFSLPTWVDGSTFLTKTGSRIGGLSDLAGKKIAVIGGTTTETALADSVQRMDVRTSIVKVANPVAGLSAVGTGAVDAYAGNRASLLVLATAGGHQSQFAVSRDLLSYEPYGLVMRRDDADFRQAVDRVLARLYRSGEVVTIYQHWFGALARPSAALAAMWAINALPE